MQPSNLILQNANHAGAIDIQKYCYNLKILSVFPTTSRKDQRFACKHQSILYSPS